MEKEELLYCILEPDWVKQRCLSYDSYQSQWFDYLQKKKDFFILTNEILALSPPDIVGAGLGRNSFLSYRGLERGMWFGL